MDAPEVLKKVRRLEIKTARLVEGMVSGGYLSRFKGRGVEFNEVREYQEGDDVRAIDWNVTARMGVPYVKTFMEERDLTVMLAVDLSASMEFGTAASTKRELALELCALVAVLAARNNDRVGLVGYTDEVGLVVPPGKGRRHAMRTLTALASASPRRKTSSPGLAASYLMDSLKARSTVFWVSDFMDMALPRPLRALSIRHELVPVVVRDNREDELPPVGLVELADPETGETFVADTGAARFREAFFAAASERDAKRAALFRALRSEPITVRTGTNPVVPLARHFERTARVKRR